MKMKRKNRRTDLRPGGGWFSPVLYRERLLRRRIPAVVLAALLAAALGVMFIVNIHDYMQDLFGGSRYADLTLDLFLFRALPWSAVIFVYLDFSCLFSRRENDFLFAQPCTKRAMFGSLAASALTLPAALLTGCWLTEMLLYTLLPGWSIDCAALTSAYLSALLETARIASAAMLAVTLTGTGLTAVLAFAPLYLTPWITNYILKMTLTECLSLVISEPSLADLVERSVINVPALIYFFTAWAMFVRRSDCVESPAVSRRAQCLLRCLAALPAAEFMVYAAASIPIWRRTGGMKGEIISTPDPAELIEALCFGLAAALMLYFLYEAITVRRPRTLVRAIPSFGFVLLGGALFLGICAASVTYFVSYVPSPGAVESVSPDFPYELRAERLSREEYIRNFEYETAGEERIAAVLDGLREAQTEQTNMLRRNLLGESIPFRAYGVRETPTVKIRLRNGIVLRRQLALQDTSMFAVWQTDPAYMERMLELPGAEEWVRVRVLESDGDERWIYDTDSLCALLSEEYSALSEEKKMIVKRYEFIITGEYAEEWEDLGMEIYGMYDGYFYRCRYLIKKADLPQTWKALRRSVTEEGY